jgi:hypothetical protein
MASGRFLSKEISESRKFARLENDSHRLIYLMILPHVDSEGRYSADPLVLSGKVLTMLRKSEEEIARALRNLHEVGLIRLYQVGGESYLEITKFHQHNKVRKDREGDSKIPPPSDDNEARSGRTPGGVREGSGRSPAQGEVEVQVQDQVQEEVEGEAQREARADAQVTRDANSSEACSLSIMLTGKNPEHERAKIRHFFRNLIGRTNSNHEQVKDDMFVWYEQYGEDGLRHLWHEALQQPPNQGFFWFVDRCNCRPNKRRSGRDVKESTSAVAVIEEKRRRDERARQEFN